MLRRMLLPIALFAVAGSCATNPATGKSMLSLISENDEIQIGKQEAEKTKRQLGLYNDPKVQEYVRRVGNELAAVSERPDLPWEFNVMDDDVVNAFALPGGPVFITRGILTHMNSEAELASVLGHEIGHITARHSVQQISKAQLAQVGLAAGSIFSKTVAQYSGLAGQGLGVLFLKFGRDAENEADELGFRYSLKDNYDVREMARMFQTLDRISAASGGGRIPEWQSTHPNPENRVAKTEERVAKLGRDVTGLKVNREQFLRITDGMVFGKNPRQGFFRGTTFYHPDLKFQFAFPANWRTSNQVSAVLGQSAEKDAVMQLMLAQGTADEAARKFFAQQGLTAGEVKKEQINGLPATSGTFQAKLEDGSTIRGLATFLTYDGRTYHFMGYSSTARFSTTGPLMRQSVQSFKPLTDSAILNVQPAKVKLETVPSDMTLAQFNQRLPSTIPVQQLAIINGIEEGTTLTAGQVVKRVIGGK